MNDLSGFLKTISKFSLYLFAAGLLLWAVLTEYRPFVAGLLLGMAISLTNFVYLGLKTRQLGELVAQGVKKRFNLGFFTRASLAVLAVMVAYKSERFDLAATIIGLFYAQTTAFVLGLFFVKKKD
ncbi:ATP synthase subunit I [Paenibacillus flagellatus]|nr:ATP synthase subunit I [Paenibacillus flagellatus]